MRSSVAGCGAGLFLTLLALNPARAGAADGPPLSVPSDQLAAALHCPARFTHPQREPVLLVHGTGVDAEAAWSWNYLRALPAAGIDTCTVDLPEDALADIQVSAEYVVHAVRAIHAATGLKVDIVGHSQGPLEPRWAIKFWPDVRAQVDDLVGLSAPNHGVPISNVICALACDAAVWQFRVGSAFLGALNAGDETPGAVDQTSVISLTDEVVTPPSTVPLAGATNIVVQSRCPGRIVGHVGMVYDAVVYAIVLDALTHAGPARLSRISLWRCLGVLMPKVTALDVAVRFAELAARLTIGAVTHRKLTAEPALKPYATAVTG